MARRYYFDKYELLTIRVADKETRCFWHRLEGDRHGGTYWQRSKKEAGREAVFATFAEAKAELTRRLGLRLAASQRLTGPGQYVWDDLYPAVTP